MHCYKFTGNEIVNWVYIRKWFFFFFFTSLVRFQFEFKLYFFFKITNSHWHTLLSSSSLKHDTCPVCRKSLNGEESGTQSSSEPSSLNTDPRTPERWSFWNTYTHTSARVIWALCLNPSLFVSLSFFCLFFVFIPPCWYIFTMVCLLLFSNTVLF